MKKHLFTIRWEREGRRAYPTFEHYSAFDWPDTVPPNVSIKAAAKVRGVTEETLMRQAIAQLPPDAHDAMRLVAGLSLRCRYSPETQGPYLIPDPDNTLTEEALLTWVEYNEGKLRGYRV